MPSKINLPLFEPIEEDSRDNNISDSIYSPRFATLEDGLVVTNAEENFSLLPNPCILSDTSRKRVDKLLREIPHEHPDIGVVNSLFLQVQMLPFGCRGMAMEFSPAQLDALDKVLIGQLKNVNEARKIKKRIPKIPLIGE